MLDTAVLFLVFNRPNTTARVMEAIRKAKPAKLYVAADGPRAGRDAEPDMCKQTREIATSVDWPCEVHTLFREQNLGCRNAVSSAITWFFEHEPEGIILEDDCLPHPDFFGFCAELLVKYRDHEAVMHISGDNFLQVRSAVSEDTESYYVSRIAHIWGWASWRRAWQHYDVSLPQVPDMVAGLKPWPFRSELEAASFKVLVEDVALHGRDTWDFQWAFTIMWKNGLCINPAHNMVSNIGYGDNATHATVAKHPFANLPTHGFKTLRHPNMLILDRDADDAVMRKIFAKPRWARFKWQVKQSLRKLFNR